MLARGTKSMRAPSNLLIDAALGIATLAGRAWMLVPPSHGVTITRNVPYGPRRRHRLDVYTPARPRGIRVLFIHGGSFRTCTKETHTYVGRTLAAAGIHVYSIDYGLAPRHAYPVAHDDAALAYRWLCEGPGRTDMLVTAGDSAGGNVAVSLAVGCAGGFGERFDGDGLRSPQAVLCLSGLLRVRGSAEAHRHSPIAHARLAQIEHDFLAGQDHAPRAEPLAAIEAGEGWSQALPPMFIAIGDTDPIAGDSHALAAALPPALCEVRRYANQGHAFMISPFAEASGRCWADAVAFLDRFFGGQTDT